MFEGALQPMHLLVIAVVALLLFGPKKLPDLGRGLGQGIRDFRNALKSGSEEAAAKPVTEEKLDPRKQA